MLSLELQSLLFDAWNIFLLQLVFFLSQNFIFFLNMLQLVLQICKFLFLLGKIK